MLCGSGTVMMFVVLIGSQGLSDAELTLLIHIGQPNVTLHQTAVVGHPFFQNLTTVLQKNKKNISQTVYIRMTQIRFWKATVM